MSKQNNLTDFLTDIADAIREKKGTTGKINPQDFSEEIRGIEGSSPFAVDFGEEIATGNPAFIGALQEDIDYYNQIQEERRLYAEGKGGRSDEELLEDQEFHERIAYWPVGMKQPSIFSGFFNIRVIEFGNDVTKLQGYNSIDTLILGGERVDYYGFSSGINSLRKVVFAKKKNLRTLGFFNNMIGCKEVDYRNSEVAVDGRGLVSGRAIWKAVGIDVTNSTTLTEMTTNRYNTPELRILELAGTKVDLDLGAAKYLYASSAKYILDHCQQSDTAYTLKLHADVLDRFIAKCTEGHEDYDAEYAAALASANEKGLTLA